MEEEKFSYETLSSIVKFLAKKGGVSMEAYISTLQQEMESEALVESLIENFKKLSVTQQAQLMRALENKAESPKENVANPARSEISGEYALVELVKKDVGDLVKTKPSGMEIDGIPFETKSWTELSCQFVKFLIDKKDLCSADLPLCVSERSAKAFVNSYPGQPIGVDADSNFLKVADGFFVDSKYNAKYHLLNMWRALKKLNISSKYNIKICL